ncbi:hypothetical protein SEA_STARPLATINUM_291 [Streptomyces phage StarPlatinum]|uniref:Uncharacterized protein n=1 Tax=Streptomyces phage StarPlatinum TaxID=2283265 RepID=A0A345M8E9_9CAUD|nr:hypothetical protein HWB77_gp021 [Streptomyces phage StarPlatinum]YP_009839684.1 hypothetical protein HWB77_gp042 [Streptomyces phage StarPlatinum]AXH66770.1 hypothetical protein SEA_STARPLATINUM_21 [Streptomyces phage StarPlatinum]AXH66994.1 hypothetical protein SEA_STARPLATINUM_291 [Streptomyces phage StarPlatinum]
MQRGQILKAKKPDPNCRIEIIDVMEKEVYVVIHLMNDHCTTMMTPPHMLDLFLEPGDSIRCVCGRFG